MQKLPLSTPFQTDLRLREEQMEMGSGRFDPEDVLDTNTVIRSIFRRECQAVLLVAWHFHIQCSQCFSCYLVKMIFTWISSFQFQINLNH